MEPILDRENTLKKNEVCLKPIEMTLRAALCVGVCREAYVSAYVDDGEFLRKFGAEGSIYL